MATNIPQTTNPYRDLPADPAVHNTIKEVSYIKSILGDLMPTSLPGDDYDLYSSALHSLETRRDLTWLVLQESDVSTCVRNISSRAEPHRASRNPILNEPFEISARASRLRQHWRALEKAAPERWEAAFDTTLIPPLLEEGHSDTSHGHAALSLSAEQAADADSMYADYLKSRNNSVAYLKRNPPKAMAWVQLEREGTTSQEAWETIGGAIPGRSVPVELLHASRHFKPIYRSLSLEDVPLAYVDPDAPPETDEERMAYYERRSARHEKRQERRKVQKTLQEQLRAEKTKES